MTYLLDEVLKRVSQMEEEAVGVLGHHDAATSARVVTLEDTYNVLSRLSVDQDELFRESLRAVEMALFRAAHVLAWAGFIDFLHHYLWDHFEAVLQDERSAWKLKSAEDLRERSDHSVIEAGRVVGAYQKTVMKALHGLLNTRNECAHPTGYYPGLNETLGYISGVFGRISFLQHKLD
jgi:hypothetical protein